MKSLPKIKIMLTEHRNIIAYIEYSQSFHPYLWEDKIGILIFVAGIIGTKGLSEKLTCSQC